jgi:hypothetical protein
MGNRRENERRVGVTRPGPAERARKEREREAARQRQRQCRLQMRERAALEVVDMQAEEADDMDADDSSLGCNRREVRRSAAATLSFVEDTLARYNNRDKEAVLRSVWSSSVTTSSLGEYCLWACTITVGGKKFKVKVSFSHETCDSHNCCEFRDSIDSKTNSACIGTSPPELVACCTQTCCKGKQRPHALDSFY